MNVRARYALASGLVAAFTLQSVIGLIHLRAERHVRCPEHGEVVHLDIADGAHAPGEAQGEDVHSTDISLEDAHDHCVVLSNVRERPCLGARAEVVPPLQKGSAVPAAHGERALAGLALLRLAPKTSPPA